MTPIPRTVAQDEMKQYGDQIRAWAAQDSNPLLKSLAAEVIRAAGENHEKR